FGFERGIHPASGSGLNVAWSVDSLHSAKRIRENSRRTIGVNGSSHFLVHPAGRILPLLRTRLIRVSRRGRGERRYSIGERLPAGIEFGWTGSSDRQRHTGGWTGSVE